MLALSGSQLAFAVDISKDERQSSYQLMTVENQAMQDDPNLNPAWFWVMDGQTLWKESSGKRAVSCSPAMVSLGRLWQVWRLAIPR